MIFMLPIEPWIKILKTANTQEQANKIVQKLKNKGYNDLLQHLILKVIIKIIGLVFLMNLK